MCQELTNLLIESQEGNPESTIEIISKFEPLIKKFRWKLGYDDAENDLIECLLITLKKMPPLTNNWQIVKYISNLCIPRIFNCQ